MLTASTATTTTASLGRRRLCLACLASLVLVLASSLGAGAILVQPNNYMLDDSPLTQQHDSSGSLSPFLNDAGAAGTEQQADRDIVSIIGDSLARLRFARMLDQQQQQQEQGGQLSQEMAELIQSEQKQAESQASEQQPSLSSSMASMLMSVAQAAAANAAQHEEAAAAAAEAEQQQGQLNQQRQHQAPGSKANIMELDTSAGQSAQSAGSLPSKADLKPTGPSQWFNPKETIPVLKISSMATPSKYKKVYFRSEKKLVDGAFHSPSGAERPAEQAAAGGSQSAKKSSLVKSFGAGSSMAGVQRRSSRGSAASAPPSVLQDGVIDFLKKFREVYVQTRPVGPSGSSSGGSSNPLSFSSVMSAAASSPFAAILAPGANGSTRPNFVQALSAAGQMVQAASSLSSSSASNSPSPSASSSSSASGSGPGAATGAAGAVGAAAAGANPNKSPLSAQSYVSFWSKTFPTWVRKMLKQMRRRSLYNSSKRQQHQHNHSGAASIGHQKLASGAVSGLANDSSVNAGTGNSASNSNNSNNSNASSSS